MVYDQVRASRAVGTLPAERWWHEKLAEKAKTYRPANTRIAGSLVYSAHACSRTLRTPPPSPKPTYNIHESEYLVECNSSNNSNATPE